MSLQNLKDSVSRIAHNMTAQEAIDKGLCVDCKKPPTFYTELGRREYKISGVCQPCWDKIWIEDNEF